MRDNDLLVLRGREVAALLAGRESEIIRTARHAYEAHGAGESSLPHSTFLRFPQEPSNRIIALPAYLGNDFEVAGIKWIASFPGNIQQGIDRASAAIILNSTRTGRPEALIEGSVISAKRTAASAALAAQSLSEGRSVSTVGLIGCGVINFEIARFLQAAFAGLERFIIYDLDQSRGESFRRTCRRELERVEIEIATDVNDVMLNASLLSLATTAVKPHLNDLSACQPGTTILHISLRDLSPEVILSTDNVVDDIDHVCRAETSLHLAEQLVGQRNFIRCSLPDILRGMAPARINSDSLTVFSPFGLGILDLAVASYVTELALQKGAGTMIESFLPPAWSERGQSLYVLPNGMTVAHLNKGETDFCYRKIFTDQAYLKHGIVLNEGDCIFDVGANIGLFSLFIGQVCPRAVIYAFEPIASLWEVLRTNAKLSKFNIKAFEYGLAHQEEIVNFTYYPHCSIISGHYPNETEERDIVKSCFFNGPGSANGAPQLSDELIEEMLAERLSSEDCVCQLRTISVVMRENEVRRIDLLKIDVEKSEMEVLAGICPTDWPRIRQIVVEVHDIEKRLEKALALLYRHGYELTVEQGSSLEKTNLYNIYAVRTSDSQTALSEDPDIEMARTVPRWASPLLLTPAASCPSFRSP